MCTAARPGLHPPPAPGPSSFVRLNPKPKRPPPAPASAGFQGTSYTGLFDAAAPSDPGSRPLPLRIQQVQHIAPPDRSKSFAKNINYFRFWSVSLQIRHDTRNNAPWLEGRSEATSVALKNSFSRPLSGPLFSSDSASSSPVRSPSRCTCAARRR